MSPAHHSAPSLLPKDRLSHSHFDVEAFAPEKRLLAWRERVGHVIDILPTSASMSADRARPMAAELDRFQGSDLVFTDARTDALDMERSLARISVDGERGFAFHIFLEGGLDTLSAYGKTFAPLPKGPSVFVLDLNQPFRMRRTESHLLTLFVPAKAVAAVVSDPEALHGRVLSPTKSLTRLIVHHAANLCSEIRKLDTQSANAAMRVTTDMLLAGFAKQVGPRSVAGQAGSAVDSAEVAVSAAIFAQIRRYIDTNLHLSELNPEHLLLVFGLPRPTLYRMFQHEGGIGSYIRTARLRQAATLLLRNPAMQVVDIAFELGFNSASDFTRAFRRAYDISPRDYRVMVHAAVA